MFLKKCKKTQKKLAIFKNCTQWPQYDSLFKNYSSSQNS